MTATPCDADISPPPDAVVGNLTFQQSSLTPSARYRRISEAIAAEHGVDVRRVYSPERTPCVTRCRDEIAYRLRGLGLSFPMVGRHLRRHHATIIQAVRRHEQRNALRPEGMQ